ncbi:MAG: DUF4276 family protein [Candidatus Contendobacter sp.]|nr:DUF4276 family protein [Candidatus Contendobacter sp.]MDG4559618.1 DUF4276 family protein [Candidatus Contendobacter sp.]
MTVRLAISVEGHTEFEFCREVLGPHLRTFDVYLEPKIVVTQRNIAGPNAKGGSVSLDRCKREVRPLLSSFDHVTTLYDFYGFRGRVAGESPDTLCDRLAEALESPHHFTPYLQVHEFEALLFAAPTLIARFLGCPAIGETLHQAVAGCGSPEAVNDNPATTPAKRIEAAFHQHLAQRYDKTFHGPLLAMETGLPAIRAACPRFDAWLTRLERLAG